jgi:eukaryotic-like serine/threonine-protein kinase
MSTTDWFRVKQIASDALDLPDAERAPFLAAACGDDRALYDEVESLLVATHAASDLYETPLVAMPAGADVVGRALQASPVTADTRVGPYRIVREIGQGGMGSVYLAERADGEFQQKVAIKFIGGRLASRALVERFRQERRILAVLDHPHIARLIDGGTTDDGWPYVVMEYVAGVAIDEHCEARRLTTVDRVRLFQDVCAAVHYAHQRLVVHRDIKPSNILVAADGTAKLLDFGIATLIDPDLTGDTRPQTIWRALTPEAASPEQVRGERVTVAADIYSLGMLLYRLLTGRSPYGDGSLDQAALLRAICDDEPRSPGVNRDLDVIILKALRKVPSRRYASAAELSEDLRRYLEGRPVLAAPDSVGYRVGKFVRRHWVATTAATAALVAILAGAGIALQQARVARGERARAERRFDDVRRLSNAFLFEFHDAIADLPGALAARQLVVKRAAEYLDALAGESQDHVPLQRELATAYQKLGTILGGGGVANLGDQKGAEVRYASALALREALAQRPDATPEDSESLAFLRVELSRFFALIGDQPRAEENARAVVAILESSPALRASPLYDGRLATAYHQLAYVQGLRRPPTNSLASYEKAMTLTRERIARQPGDPVDVQRLVRIAPDYASQLLHAGRAQEAGDVLSDARSRLETLLAADPQNKRYRNYLVRILNPLGDAHRALDDRDAAVKTYEDAARLADQLRAEEPADQEAQMAAMFSHCALGRGLLLNGSHDAGVGRLRECVGDGEAIAKRASNNFILGELAFAKLDLGQALMKGPSGTSSARDTLDGCRSIREGLDLSTAVASKAPALAASADARKPFEAMLAACDPRGTGGSR